MEVARLPGWKGRNQIHCMVGTPQSRRVTGAELKGLTVSTGRRRWQPGPKGPAGEGMETGSLEFRHTPGIWPALSRSAHSADSINTHELGPGMQNSGAGPEARGEG